MKKKVIAAMLMILTAAGSTAVSTQAASWNKNCIPYTNGSYVVQGADADKILQQNGQQPDCNGSFNGVHSKDCAVGNLSGLLYGAKKPELGTKPGNNCSKPGFVYQPGAENRPGTENQPETNRPGTDNKPGAENKPGTENKPNIDTDKPGNSDPTERSFAEQVVQLVNKERAKAGLQALTLDKQIASAALTRSKEIETSFSHTRPNGSAFSTVFAEHGVTFRGSGENIAWGQRTPEAVMDAWMNSEGHRANILNPKFTKIGVGHRQNSAGTHYWTQLFTY